MTDHCGFCSCEATLIALPPHRVPLCDRCAPAYFAGIDRAEREHTERMARYDSRGWGDRIPAAEQAEAAGHRNAEFMRYPFVRIMPRMMSGNPCVGDHRLTTDQIAGIYWEYGLDEVLGEWPDLTPLHIWAACWAEASFLRGKGAMHKAWRRWAKAHYGKDYAYAWPEGDLPPTRVEEDT